MFHFLLFLHLICSSSVFNSVPLFFFFFILGKLCLRCQSLAASGPYTNDPFRISTRFPSRRLNIAESPLLPEPGGSVFLGILRKTLSVDPGVTPCPVPGL